MPTATRIANEKSFVMLIVESWSMAKGVQAVETDRQSKRRDSTGGRRTHILGGGGGGSGQVKWKV